MIKRQPRVEFPVCIVLVTDSWVRIHPEKRYGEYIDDSRSRQGEIRNIGGFRLKVFQSMVETFKGKSS